MRAMVEAFSFCIQEQNICYTKTTFTNIHHVPQRNFKHFPNYPLTQTYQPMGNNSYRFRQQFSRQKINVTSNTFRQNRHSYPKNIPNNGLEQTRTFSNNNNNSLNNTFGRQQYSAKHLLPPEQMNVSSGYTHLRKPQSMQTMRTTNGFKPHEMHNINIEGTPYANLEEYYYYPENDQVQKDVTFAQNNLKRDFILDKVLNTTKTTVTQFTAENFLLDASPDQLDI